MAIALIHSEGRITQALVLSLKCKNKKSRGIMIRMYSHLRETFYRAVCRQKLATLPILFACAFAYIVTFQTPGNART